MAIGDLFRRLAQRVMGSDEEPAWPPTALVGDGVEAVVDAVEPRIRLLPRYAAKLEGGVRRTFVHLRALGRDALHQPLELSPAAWNSDRAINAYFAGPQDIIRLAGRSDELRAFFDAPENRGLDAAFLLLGMAMEERTVFAPVLSGERVVHDVRQTTVSFSNHRLLAPGPSFQEARVEIGWRFLRRLAAEAADRIAGVQAQGADLEERKAMLVTKLRAMRARQGGLEALTQETVQEDRIAEIERAIADTRQELLETKASISSLDGYVEQINQVLGRPEEFVGISSRRIRLNRMGMRIDENQAADPNAANLLLTVITLGAHTRCIAEIVRFPRALMPPKEDLLAQAERYL